MKTVIVVLAHQFGSEGEPCETSIARLDAALEQKLKYEQAGDEVHICVTGYTPYSKLIPFSLAQLMKNYLLKRGIPEDKILIGLRGGRQKDEAFIITIQLAYDRYERVVLISSDWQWLVKRQWMRAAREKAISFTAVPVRGTGNKVRRFFGKFFGSQEGEGVEITAPLKYST